MPEINSTQAGILLFGASVLVGAVATGLTIRAVRTFMNKARAEGDAMQADAEHFALRDLKNM